MATRKSSRRSPGKRELTESKDTSNERQLLCEEFCEDKNNNVLKEKIGEDVLMYDSDNKENKDASSTKQVEPKEQLTDSAVASVLSMDVLGEESNSSIAMSDDSSRISSENILTESIIAEEEACTKENEIEVEKLQQEAVKQFQSLEQQQRFARLQHLLKCSNIYAQFLLERMKKQREESSKTEEKDTEDNGTSKENRDEKSGSGSSATASPSRRSKRKRGKSKYRVEDYITEEALNKQVKKRKTDTEEPKDNQVVPGSPKQDVPLTAKDSYSRRINGEKVSDRQPGLFTGGVLRSYQLDGMEWLKGLFENGINGILGDEMGLGKTVQVIALLAFLVEKGIQGPFLIVAPLSTLPNWVNEFKRFTPEIYSLLYHGTKDDRIRLRKRLRMKKGETHKSFPAVITSYQMILSDKSVLANFKWKYIVVDEAQRLKNMNCKLMIELKQFQTANRLLLSGTPLQNNLSELWSLLNFLLPDIFDDLSSFQAWFDFKAISEEGGDEKIIAQEQEEHVLQTLHSILTPFLLRRLKTDVELELPPKKEVVVYAKMAPLQSKMYKECLDRTITKRLKKDEEQVEVEESAVDEQPTRRSRRKSNRKVCLVDDESEDAVTFYERICQRNVEKEEAKQKQKDEEDERKSNQESELHIRILNVVMMLRSCCNHPYLIDFPLDKETKDYRIDEGIVQHSGKMRLLDQMLPRLKAGGHKVLIFSQFTSMLDIIGYYLEMRDYKFSRLDGSMSFANRALEMKEFHEDPSVFCFLLSTRAGGLGLNLMAADTAIIYDSDWNPQCDLQAQDRCHRIGQTRPVVVYRLLLKNSVDETMAEVANKKRKLEKMVIHKDHFKGKEAAKALSKAELMALLQTTDHNVAVDSDDTAQPLSDEMLEELLDRTDLTGNQLKASTSKHNKLFKIVEAKESLDSFSNVNSQ